MQYSTPYIFELLIKSYTSILLRVHITRKNRYYPDQETRAAALILTMVVLQSVFYIPWGGIWTAYALAPVFGGFAPAFATLLTAVGRTVTILTLLTKTWNLYIYIARVPHFARAMLVICTFGAVKHISGSSMLSSLRSNRLAHTASASEQQR